MRKHLDYFRLHLILLWIDDKQPTLRCGLVIDLIFHTYVFRVRLYHNFFLDLTKLNYADKLYEFFLAQLTPNNNCFTIDTYTDLRIKEKKKVHKYFNVCCLDY